MKSAMTRKPNISVFWGKGPNRVCDAWVAIVNSGNRNAENYISRTQWFLKGFKKEAVIWANREAARQLRQQRKMKGLI